MIRKYFALSLLLSLLTACVSPQISGNLNARVDSGVFPPNPEESFQYTYTNEILVIKHHGAIFNGVMDRVKTTGKVSKNIITLTSVEEYDMGPCDSYASYNVEYIVSNLSEGTYTVIIDNREAEGGSRASFPIDLSKNKSGTYSPKQNN